MRVPLLYLFIIFFFSFIVFNYYFFFILGKFQGYYRRAEALKGLGRHEDALLSLLHCAAMERSLMCDVRDDIAKVSLELFLK